MIVAAVAAVVAVVVLFLAGKLHPFVQLDRTRNETAADRKKKQLVATFYSFAIFFSTLPSVAKIFRSENFQKCRQCEAKEEID